MTENSVAAVILTPNSLNHKTFMQISNGRAENVLKVG